MAARCSATVVFSVSLYTYHITNFSKSSGPSLEAGSSVSHDATGHVPLCNVGYGLKETFALTVENEVIIAAIDYMKWDYAGCHFFVAWRFSLDDLCFSSCITIMISSAKH